MIFSVPGHIEMIRSGKKTQTRRLTRGIYQIGRDYAVQPKRGMKAEKDMKIVMDRIWEEKALGFLAKNEKMYPSESPTRTKVRGMR